MKLKTLKSALVLAVILASASAMAEPIQSKGVVTAVNPDKQKITLNHDPIPELGWPQMTMGFSVAPEVDLGGLTKGDKVTFSLVPEGKSQTITDISKQ